MCGIVCTIPGDLDLTISMLEILEEYVGGRNAFRLFSSKGGSGTGLMRLSNDKLSRIRSNSFAREISAKAQDAGWCGGEILVGHTRFSDIIIPVEERFVHPYSDCRNSFYVVHNGAVNNHELYYDQLKMQGHQFRTENKGIIVDSEVIPHLLEDELKQKEIGIESLLGAGRTILGKLGKTSVEEGLGMFVVLLDGLNIALIVHHIHSWGNTLKFWTNDDITVVSTYNVLPYRRIVLEPPPYGGVNLEEMNKRIDNIIKNQGFDEIGYTKRGVVFAITSKATIVSLCGEKLKEERIDETNLLASSIRL
ncbi:MAG: hypothetical protein ACFE7E_00360 [Candidatus Hodarchaeota archaeon]